MCRPAHHASRILGRRALLRLGCVTLAWLVGSPLRAFAQSPRESLDELERRTREYQETLERLLAVEVQAAALADADVERYRTLHAQGLVARQDVDRAVQAAAAARERVRDARIRLTDSSRALAEAQGLARLAALPPPSAPGGERATPEVAEYRGISPWTLAQVATLEEFFTARFGRSLPVSALGQTPTHDRLGFDHRNAVDVAVHPDSPEGRALLGYLRANGIPYLAFRGALAGASTGAHVHVGAASPRRG